MKTISLLALLVLIGNGILAVDSSVSSPSAFKPTWAGDEHTPPVYTSPVIAPSTNFFLETNNVPSNNVPSTNNWPVTNIPSPTPPPP